MTDPYATPTSETPFQILVLADLSGRANRGLQETGRALGARKPLAVDRDDLDAVVRRLQPELHLTTGDELGDQVTLTFTELDDFDPDQIVRRCPLFGRLRDLRSRLDDERTFAAASTEVQSWSAAPQSPGDASAPDPETPAAPEGNAGVSVTDVFGDNFMDQVLDASSASDAGDDWDAVVRGIAGPALRKITVPGRAPEQDELVAFVDGLMAEQLRTILHHPDFQALEAAWRSIYEMTRRLRTGPLLKLFVLDVSSAEIRADLAQKDVTAAGLHRIVVEQTVGIAGANPWTLIVGDYTFDATPQDVTVLLRMSKLARAAGAAFLAGADGKVVGCEDVSRTPEVADWTHPGDPAGHKVWDVLRGLPEASLLGLVWPRYLVRQPYGAAADPCEDFPFEELSGRPGHGEYLWGNGAFVAAIALASAFAEHGWELLRGYDPEMADLPTHTYDDEGDPMLLPCAEAWVTISASEVVADKGVMPLLSVRHQGAVRLARLNSLASPGVTLVGRWS